MALLSHPWSRTHGFLQGSAVPWAWLWASFLRPLRFALLCHPGTHWFMLILWALSSPLLAQPKAFPGFWQSCPISLLSENWGEEHMFPIAYKNVILKKSCWPKVIFVEHLEINAEPCCWFHPVQTCNYQKSWCCSAGKQCFKHNLLRSNRDQANRCPVSLTKTQILFRGKLASTAAAWIQFIKVPEKATMKKRDKQSSERTIADRLWHNQETSFSRMEKGDARPFSH